jgi:hypothetical protein
MNTLRATAFALACAAGLGIGTASAGEDDPQWMPHHYGHMGMMGPGYGWMGHGPAWMMGPGHGWSGCGPGAMMGYGQGWRSGSGKDGKFHRGMMDPAKLSDEQLDSIGERMAQRHQAMQEIVSEQDPAARREMIREHLKSRQARRGGGYWDDDDDSDDATRRGPRSGMMGGGMMGGGMMGGGAGGMGPGMMYGGQITDEHLDRMAEHMAERHQRMHQIAETTDKEERRKLMREHFQSMRQFMGGPGMQ